MVINANVKQWSGICPSVHRAASGSAPRQHTFRPFCLRAGTLASRSCRPCPLHTQNCSIGGSVLAISIIDYTVITKTHLLLLGLYQLPPFRQPQPRIATVRNASITRSILILVSGEPAGVYIPASNYFANLRWRAASRRSNLTTPSSTLHIFVHIVITQMRTGSAA